MIYLKNRYDILLGNPGRLIHPITAKYFFVHGPRGSGKTSYLARNLLEITNNSRTCFISYNETRSSYLRNSILPTLPGNNRFPMFLTLQTASNLRGMTIDYLYWDDFDDAIRVSSSIASKIFVNLLRTQKQVMISSSQWNMDQIPNYTWRVIEISKG